MTIDEQRYLSGEINIVKYIENSAIANVIKNSSDVFSDAVIEKMKSEITPEIIHLILKKNLITSLNDVVRFGFEKISLEELRKYTDEHNWATYLNHYVRNYIEPEDKLVLKILQTIINHNSYYAQEMLIYCSFINDIHVSEEIIKMKNRILSGEIRADMLYFQAKVIDGLLKKDKDFIDQLSKITFTDEQLTQFADVEGVGRVIPYTNTKVKTVKTESWLNFDVDFLNWVKIANIKIDISKSNNVINKETFIEKDMLDKIILNQEQKEDFIKYIEKHYNKETLKKFIKGQTQQKNSTRKLI